MADTAYLDAATGKLLHQRTDVRPVMSAQRFISGLRYIQFRHWILRWVHYRRAIPRILIAAAAAPKPLSMFIAITPGAQLDSAAFNATAPPEATP